VSEGGSKKVVEAQLERGLNLSQNARRTCYEGYDAYEFVRILIAVHPSFYFDVA